MTLRKTVNFIKSKFTRKTLPDKPKPEKVGWGPLVAVFITVVIYFAAQVLGALVLGVYGNIHHWNQSTINNWLNNSVNAQFFYTVIAEGASLLILWAILKRYKATFKTLGFNRPKLRFIWYIIVGFGVYLIGLDILTSLAKRVDQSLNLNQQQAVGFQSATGPELILVVISLVILPPIVEELLFRGFLYSGLRKVMPAIWAGLFTSILFAIPHLFESASGGLLWVAGIDTFTLSLVLVYLREKTNSIWPCIGLHALKNGIAFLALFVFRVG